MKTQSLASLYAKELLRLVFAHDQASSYLEGFVALSCSRAARTQMRLFQEEVNIQLIAVANLFTAVDFALNDDARAMEQVVADEMVLVVDAEYGSFATDAEILAAAQKLQAYLAGLAHNVLKLAGTLNLSSDKRCIDDLGWAMSLRSRSIANLQNGGEPQEEPRFEIAMRA